MSHAGLLDTRSRRRYVGTNGSERVPLLGGNSSKSPITLSQFLYGLSIFIVVGAAVGGLITGSIALSYGKNDVNDPLTLGSLLLGSLNVSSIQVDKIKVTNMTDLSMSEVLPGMWMTPPLPPARKRSKRMTVDYDVNPADRQIVLGNAGVTYNIRFPKNLNGYVSKEYHLFSNTSQPHTVVFTGAGCGGTYADTTWDAARQKPLAKFDAEPGAYIHFKVVDCGTVTLIESRKVDFCFENMTHCEHPKRDVNADWADVKDLNAVNIDTNMLTMQPLVVSESEELAATHNVIHLAGSTGVNLTLPIDLTPMIGKTLRICNANGEEHVIDATSAGATWDTNGYWSVLKFQPNSAGCCLDVQVLTASAVSLVSRSEQCTVYCATINQYHCIDPARPRETNSWHGPYILENGPAATGVPSGLKVSYIDIDATKSPMQYELFTGTHTFPRRCQSNDGCPNPNIGVLYMLGDDLASDAPSLTNNPPGFIALTFKLNENRIFQQSANFKNSGFLTLNTLAAVYSKITSLPRIYSQDASDNIDMDPMDPRNLVEYYFDLTHRRTHGLFNNFAELAPVEFGLTNIPAEAQLSKLIKTGVTYTVPIDSILVTQNSTELPFTTIRTTSFHHVNEFAIVKLSGFTDPEFSVLNGNLYPSHQLGLTTTPDTNADFIDITPGNPAASGVKFEFNIELNTTLFPHVNGKAVFTGSPVIEVQYGPIDSSTEYRPMLAAIKEVYQSTIGVGIHDGIRVWYDGSSFPLSNQLKVYDTWAQVQAGLSAGTARGVEPTPRQYNPSGTTFYHNAMIYECLLNTIDRYNTYAGSVNDPFDIRVYENRCDQNSIFNYDVDIENYLINPKYLVWKTSGSDLSTIINAIVSMIYPPANGSTGRTFEGVLLNMTEDPPANHNFMNPIPGLNFDLYQAFKTARPVLFEYFKRDFMLGIINPDLTPGFRIGYLRFQDFIFGDRFSLFYHSDMAPDGSENGPRDSLEPFIQVLAPVFEFFNDENVDSIIVDVRNNVGGSVVFLDVLEQFFGADRQGHRLDGLFTSTGKGENIALQNFSVFEDVTSMNEFLLRKSDVLTSRTEAIHPGSTFTNGELILLTSTASRSAGDLVAAIFVGNNGTNDLGANVTTSILGNIEGRVIGTTEGNNAHPYSSKAPRLVNNLGQPRQAFTTRRESIDLGLSLRRDGSPIYARSAALQPDACPTLTGKAGNAALSSAFEDTIHVDFGYVTPHPDAPLSGWTAGAPTPTNRSTWRDRWLEQAILKATSSKKRASFKRSFKRSSKKTVRQEKRTGLPQYVCHDEADVHTIDISAMPEDMVETFTLTPSTDMNDSTLENRQILVKMQDMLTKELESGGICYSTSLNAYGITSKCKSFPVLKQSSL